MRVEGLRLPEMARSEIKGPISVWPIIIAEASLMKQLHTLRYCILQMFQIEYIFYIPVIMLRCFFFASGPWKRRLPRKHEIGELLKST